MTPERWARVQQLFDDALACAPGERGAFLDRACGADAALRDEVRSLVEADTGPTPPVLDAHAETLAAAVRPRGGAPAPPAVSPPAVGRVLGPYRVVRELGRGGMGAVYLAEREDVGKRVALKLLADARPSPGAVRRILTERRVLARLEHPNIARLLDAGLTEAGTPYFAMEYVDGAPLVAACDARCLTVRDRLLLFERVCDAVAYAHRNLVVHRDLKPSNVLVAGDGTVKLLDFGIAKLLAAADPPATRDAALAETRRGGDDPTSGTWLMTPRYAAPEQRRGGLVTTATDVYALGLVLEELLAGRRPPRRGREDTRADTHAHAERAAAARGTTPAGLRRALAGDLDAIIRRATAEDPAARYASADELAADVRRHLAHRPVQARPQTLRYRTSRLVRRRRAGVVAAAGVVVLVGAFTVELARQTRIARTERDRARLEAATSARVTDFTTGLLLGGSAWTGTGPATTAGELIARAGRRVDSLGAEPVVQARLLGVLGGVNHSLGRAEEARRQLLRAIALQRALPGASPLDLAESLARLGSASGQAGDYAGADSLFTESLGIRRRLLGDTALALGANYAGLATVAWMRGDEGRAERLYRQAVAIEGAPGRPPRVGLTTLSNLSRLLSHQGRYADASVVTTAALPRALAAFGPAHRVTAGLLTDLSQVRQALGDRVGADTLAAAALRATEDAGERTGVNYAAAVARLADTRRELGHLGEADTLARRAGAALAAAGEVDAAEASGVHLITAWVRGDLGDIAGSVRAARTAVTADERADAAGEFRVYYQVALGGALQRAGAYAEAERVLDAVAAALPRLPASHPVRPSYALWRGALYDATGRSAAAEPLLRSALATRRAQLPPGDYLLAEAESRLGACLARLGREAEAEALLQSGHDKLLAARGAADPYTRAAAARLGPPRGDARLRLARAVGP